MKRAVKTALAVTAGAAAAVIGGVVATSLRSRSAEPMPGDDLRPRCAKCGRYRSRDGSPCRCCARKAAGSNGRALSAV